MRFFRLPVLGAILFFGVVCAQEKPKSLPEEIAIYTSTNVPNFIIVKTKCPKNFDMTKIRKAVIWTAFSSVVLKSV